MDYSTQPPHGDDDAAAQESIKDRVVELRKRRGLTQEVLAERAGLSVQVIRKIEQGGKVRMETYHAIARVFGVRTVWFTSPETPDPTPAHHRDTVLFDIRTAINPPAGLSGRLFSMDSSPPNLPMLESAVASIANAYQENEYDLVARVAPAAVRSAHAHVSVLDGDQQRAAVRLRGDALQLTGRYLVQIREHDLALIALRDALSDAIRVGDQALAAAAIGQQGWALLRQARFTEVEHLCMTTAEEIEPRMSRASPDELAAWGYLLMRASAAAARNNRSEEAADIQSLAASAAARLGTDRDAAGHMRFGPATVGMNGMQNELIAGNPDVALEMSAGLNVDGVTPNTRQRHELDQAKARVLVGDADGAEATLHDLRADAPEWLRQQRAAREIAEDIWDATRKKRKPSQELRDLTEFLGVPL
ncbi:helix-turn-helix domain-containing protein [Streptomonospora litoralis]|uniref:Anaerobic benzoate catabolism transcriptional regulator n=1 Tax=Streptomonospora litoralis TaxID=2498135 RepID=A0A4P6QBG1_9ACTN|nr:helix-turn-helix transcriptional regulator [Streptomonospora litoralis]QBI56777.1 anaerobic benzoate catabolism transcriptional regulator [Streptomonospora litoralis]